MQKQISKKHMRLLSSYYSVDEVRHAKVFAIEDFDQRPYQYRVYTTDPENNNAFAGQIPFKDFIHTNEAEDFAEDWVQKY